MTLGTNAPTDSDREEVTAVTFQNKNREGIKSAIGVLSQPGRDVGKDRFRADREIAASITQVHLVRFFLVKFSEP